MRYHVGAWRPAAPALRALRSATTEALEFDHERNAMASFGDPRHFYFDADLTDLPVRQTAPVS